VIAALMAADPDVRDDPNVDPAQRALFLEAHAGLLAGAIQALASWWEDHRHVPREVVTDRAMEFCWLGLERLSDGRRLRRGAARRG
jgi:hypothetical protein